MARVMSRVGIVPILLASGVAASACGSSSNRPSARTPGPATASMPQTSTAASTGMAVAQDLRAKSLVRTAQTATETLAVDDGGSYFRVTPSAIAGVEPNVPTSPGGGQAYLSAAHGTATTYSITVTSASGDAFTILRDGRGRIFRTCTGSASPQCQAGKW